MGHAARTWQICRQHVAAIWAADSCPRYSWLPQWGLRNPLRNPLELPALALCALASAYRYRRHRPVRGKAAHKCCGHWCRHENHVSSPIAEWYMRLDIWLFFLLLSSWVCFLAGAFALLFLKFTWSNLSSFASGACCENLAVYSTTFCCDLLCRLCPRYSWLPQ